jgi:hypothetical protein
MLTIPSLKRLGEAGELKVRGQSGLCRETLSEKFKK